MSMFAAGNDIFMQHVMMPKFIYIIMCQVVIITVIAWWYDYIP